MTQDMTIVGPGIRSSPNDAQSRHTMMVYEPHCRCPTCNAMALQPPRVSSSQNGHQSSSHLRVVLSLQIGNLTLISPQHRCGECLQLDWVLCLLKPPPFFFCNTCSLLLLGIAYLALIRDTVGHVQPSIYICACVCAYCM